MSHAVVCPQPFYDSVATTLRSADQKHLVFFEPVTWSGQPLINNATVGFTHAPGGAQNALTSALSFHYYSAPNFGNATEYFERRVFVRVCLGVCCECWSCCFACVLVRCMVVWLYGCFVVWLFGRLVAWSLCCLAVWLFGC